MGVDIGTSSVKAVAVDASGAVVARARIPHPVEMPTPDVFQHDARAAWCDGVQAAVGEVAAGQRVLGITVAAMVPSLCAVDADGRPISPGLLYGDARGGTGGGAPTDSGELVGFLRWLAGRYPDAAGFWPAQAVANAALGGPGAIDTVTAMTAMPLFDGNGWDTTQCGSAGASTDQLPALVPGTDAIASVDGARISGGTIDALGEQIVAGADAPGDVLVICGTTLIVWAVVKDWREVDGLWTVPHTAPGLTLIGGASNAGGLFVDRVRHIVADVAGHEMAGLAPDRVPVWVPYIRGERTPHHDADLRASLIDVDVSHERASVLRAAYEATGFVVRHHLDLASVAAERIVATGGGVQAPEWMQALADTTGLPVDVSAVAEGAALGAAYMARVTAGLEPDLSAAGRWARTDRQVQPRPDWVGPCEGRYRRFREVAG